ncbi:MAG: YcjF family protein [Candidatus Thiodiazotropha sp.]|jgi:uncharacterized protein (DUF697 family)
MGCDDQININTLGNLMDTQVSTERQREASNIISGYMGWSSGASLLPVPLVDIAAVTLIQIKMVSDLAKLYDVPFSGNVAKSIIAGLLGSLIPTGLVRGTSSLLKAVPGIGSLLGMISAPAFTSASTYAIGRLFTRHFDTGGSLLDFDVKSKRDEFKKEFDEGLDKKHTKDASSKPATA